MGGRRKYGRPHRGDLLCMMVKNAVMGFFVLWFVFWLFDVSSIVPERAAAFGVLLSPDKWMFLGFLLPGASIGFGCLWYWLVIVGRSRGVPWGAALSYGIFIALANVPLSGFFLGLMYGSPFLGALIGLALLMLVPSLLMSMLVFGLLMGAFNGSEAANWITRHRPE